MEVILHCEFVCSLLFVADASPCGVPKGEYSIVGWALILSLFVCIWMTFHILTRNINTKYIDTKIFAKIDVI